MNIEVPDEGHDIFTLQKLRVYSIIKSKKWSKNPSEYLNRL
jgi:hypothetical protein